MELFQYGIPTAIDYWWLRSPALYDDGSYPITRYGSLSDGGPYYDEYDVYNSYG